MRTKKLLLGVVALAAVGLAACADNLATINTNNPDIDRIFREPTDIEGVALTLYRTYHQATQGAAGGLSTQSKAMSLESYGQVANFGMNIRGQIEPRNGIDNFRGNEVSGGNEANWNSLSRLMRTSSVVAQAVDVMLDDGKTMGDAGRNLRSRSFAFFVNGIAMGTLALGYDSVHIVTTKTPQSGPGAIPPLSDYNVALDSALRMLDSAIAIIDAAVVAGGTTDIPANWLRGKNVSATISSADYVRLIRSFRAKLRAGVARTPAERAAVNWTLVLADAQNGITADHTVELSDDDGGWSSGVDANTFQTSSSWHQISLVYSGMADTSGAYQAMMGNVAWADRIGMNVLVKTPDTRWPSGETRAEQVANSTLPLGPGQYIANRDPGGDQPDESTPAGTSQYDHRRWWFIDDAPNAGTMVFVPKAEIDLLAAEAHIRLGAPASAVPLINTTRIANGLEEILDGGIPVPGGAACVPRLPNGTCGSLMEALKYEKRMETQLLGYMQWFLDSRGWGDLITGTSLHWPVPNQEMDTRNLPFYNMPSTGTLPASGVGTYGF
jgi:hypothetical protein